ncbi:serine hydrolase domain-containing protein [Catellatospora chokoriensis]|uniref:D-Ala-D-Ala carboxypeptidase n=1 Tax=Catellatospora chokoriensis TaxID=310353 RepID=A0A8J3K1B5_9ACTN|nr:serine hydrolase domain-containing protein [Catellatospora chokoriensis]GIF91126.1 D-Ala-D-Ala carboxypeptidase [Catellatospora chokoriensis]
MLKQIDQASLQAAVDTAVKQMLVPGAVVLVCTPQGSHAVLSGTLQRGAQTPPATGTHFRIGSNTKTMTAATVLQLAQEGRLKLSDPISAYVPDVPDGANITIEQLLKMRSGLYNYTDAPELSATMDADPAKAWTPQELLALAFRHPPNSAPGTEYDYNNTNYLLLGLVAEKVGGAPLGRQFQERLYAPLGLDQTSLPAPEDTAIPAPGSHGYLYGGSAHAMTDEPYPADMQAAMRDGTSAPIDYTNQNPSYAGAAGAAISTAENLATWIKSLATGKVLDADMQQRWLGSLQAENPDAGALGQQYGYGIAYQPIAPNVALHFHGGELPGFNSFMAHDLANDVTMVIWTNLTIDPGGQKTAIALVPTVLNQVYAGLNLPTAPSPHPAPSPTR